MSANIRVYNALLLALVLGWLLLRAEAIIEPRGIRDVTALVGITALYFASHVFRMLRLVLLTLDERDKAFPLIAAHSLTAFPSSFLPFKIGEVLRLAAFFHVFGSGRKALAVWVAERFGDILVITTFILGLYLFKVSVPTSMRAVFVLFALASIFGLLGLFAVAKVFVYLNRHLVLSSYSARGLTLLRASHTLRLLEVNIYKSVEGRLTGFLLLSVLVWVLEIIALSLFINLFAEGESDFTSMFASGLLASLPGGVVDGANVFGLYQSLALVVLAVIFIAILWAMNRMRTVRM